MSAAPAAAVQKSIHECILWRGTFLPGHEACRLFSQGSQRHLEGVALFSHEELPCRLDYHIACDEHWRTTSAEVNGWVGNTNVDMHLAVTPEQHWLLDGIEQPTLSGCSDLDLNFSPSTNLLPIRRLQLGIGEAAEVKAAWLRFPSLRLEPLEQKYTRLGELTYRYESAGGKFTTQLKVDSAGFVIVYPEIWKSEATYANQG